MAIKMSILRSFIFAGYLWQNLYSVVGQALVTENPKQEPALQYCSFFNNRAPQAQPGLKNCTWFKDNSCCQQQEIEATFGVVKPLKGASVQCQRFINYLMCYICAPNQNTFYQKERLTVCDSFCHSFYEACLGASLKGNRIVELYPNGREFCISRRFLVGSSNCFNFDVALDTKASSGRSTKDPSLALLLASLLFFYYLLTNLIKSTFCENLRNRVTELTGEMITERKITLKYGGVMCKQFGGEKWIVLLFAASIGMVGSAAADGADSMEVIRGEDVRLWASALSRDLGMISEDGLAFSAVQKLYREMPYKTVRVSRVDELTKLKESLENYFSEKKRLARDTAHRAAQIYDKLAVEEGDVWISGDDLDYKSVDDLPHAVYLAANRLYSYQLNESRDYSSLLRQKVIWGQSVVKLPDSVNPKKKDVIQTVDWTSRLDETFKENKRNYPELKWQYFGSYTGVFRLYPGVEWRRDFVGFPEDFEPRMQPWYVDLKSGARNVIIIIDTSTPMKKKGLFRAKNVASVLIGSLNQNHNVAVLESSSSVWDTDGKNQSGAVNVLGCRRAGLYPATSHHKEDLVMAVQQLSMKGGSDHLPAFRKAFDLLRLRQTEDPAGKDCGSIIVFITGGKLDDDDIRCTPGFHKYSEDNRKSFHAGDYCKYDSEMLLKAISLLQYSLPGSQAKIFTFVTLVETKMDLRLPGDIACENNGVMSKILANDDDSSFYDQMEAYFRYVEATKTLSDPLLTDVYVSPIDDSATFTVSSAVVSNVTKKRIGVMGIDLALSEVEDMLRSSFRGGGDVFLVDLADSTAIIHPLAKHSYEIEDFLPHVFLSELETENGVPEDFAIVLKEMMAGKTGNHTITNNARVAFLHKGNLIWRHVKSVQYFFTHITDTQFGIGVKYYSLNEEEMIEDVDDVVETSYYHSIITSESDELKDVQDQLDIATSSSKYYQGVNISSLHSVVAFGPEAFCNYSIYHEQFGSSVSQIQAALNGGDSIGQPCIIKAAARRDALVTLAMESVWQSRNSTSLADVASTYMATPSGMIRVYPGVTVPKTELLLMNKESWYTRAVVNRGVLTISSPRHGRHVNDVVVTMSRAVLNGSNCDVSFTSCDYLKVRGVVGIDVGETEFQVLVRSSLANESDQMERSCSGNSRRYPCYANRNQMCQTQCYLINSVGEVVYGLPQWRRNVVLSELHNYIVKVLQHNRIFVQKQRVGYQATCLDTGEVINAEKDAGNIKHLFEVRHSCVEETLFYEVDRERLVKDFSGVFSRSLDDDPCHSGIFFLTPVINTDLLLLVFDDFQDLSENATNRPCQKFKKESQPMTKRVERRPCHENVTLGATPYIDPCSRARAFVMPCGYSTAALAAFHSFVFLFLCFLLTLVFLI